MTPHVPVIRKDDTGILLDEYYTCTIVSIPAPNAYYVLAQEADRVAVVPKAQKPGCTDPVEHITLSQALTDRIFRALCILAQQGCTDLVLGAFGCGVHGNHPNMVAQIFRDQLQLLPGYFRTVAYAMEPSRNGNYEAFQEVFPQAATM